MSSFRFSYTLKSDFLCWPGIRQSMLREWDRERGSYYRARGRSRIVVYVFLCFSSWRRTGFSANSFTCKAVHNTVVVRYVSQSNLRPWVTLQMCTRLTLNGESCECLGYPERARSHCWQALGNSRLTFRHGYVHLVRMGLGLFSSDLTMDGGTSTVADLWDLVVVELDLAHQTRCYLRGIEGGL